MHPNEQLLRTAVEAMQNGDGERVAEVMAADVIVHLPGRSKLAGDHHGRGVLGAKIRELTGHPLRLEIHDVLGSDDHAVGVYTMTAERDGKTVQWRHVNVYHVRDGQIVEVWQHPFDLDVIEDFFS